MAKKNISPREIVKVKDHTTGNVKPMPYSSFLSIQEEVASVNGKSAKRYTMVDSDGKGK